MTTIRIWTLESDYDAKTVECLANKLVKYLQLGSLRIISSGKRALPKRAKSGITSNDALRRATEIYLKEVSCVIFVIDSDGPMSIHRRQQESNSLINQIDRIVKDDKLNDKVFCVKAVHEIEAWLLIDCLGIFCHFASQRTQFKEDCRSRVLAKKAFEQLIRKKQKGDTEKIVEPESGSKGAKEYLKRFSEEILLKLNPKMPRKNVENQRYREAMSPEIAEHVIIDGNTLKRNNSLRNLGELLTRFN